MAATIAAAAAETWEYALWTGLAVDTRPFRVLLWGEVAGKVTRVTAWK